MTRSNDNRVSVHVDVVVDGASVCQFPPLKGTESRAGFILKPLQIIYPPPSTPSLPTDTPVTVSGGMNFISANGTAPPFVFPPQAIWALAYDSTNPFLFPPLTKDGAAVPGTLNSDGTWSFGTVIPGAHCDRIAGGSNNSTIVVWYDLGLPLGIMPSELVAFHGLCPGSGSGSGPRPGIATIQAHAHVRATTLHATFTNALAALGTVALHWNGVSWMGESSGHHASVLTLLCNDTVCQLQAGGPGTNFVVAARPTSHRPFHWAAMGTALGGLAGSFGVTIVE